MEYADNPFGARASLSVAGQSVSYYSLAALRDLADVERLPHTVKILLENVLRNCGRESFEPGHVEVLARWSPEQARDAELPFLPARVLLQDYTGVPAVVDLAAMRSAMQRLGRDPAKVNPLLPADLVIDHSVQIDLFGSTEAFTANVRREYERNVERYALLRWAQQAFDGLSVVPPGTGICHQVNLEFLAKVVQARPVDGEMVALPDTLVGADSHTTMVNGLGVLAWGVGGIEAEGAMLGQPLYMLLPEVVGVRFSGQLREGATATDLVLTVTQMLRKHGVVGRFVEYCGPGLSRLPVADRATIGNMSPEYGATAGFFPVDAETLNYLRVTGRPPELLDLVERYTKEQGLFRTDETADPIFDELLELDLASVEPSLAGPRRPQDRVGLSEVGRAFRAAFEGRIGNGVEHAEAAVNSALAATFPASDALPAQSKQPGGSEQELGQPVVAADLSEPPAETRLSESETTKVGHGSVVIAAITSCTNTSNPSVMLGAGLLAKKAVERGLRAKPYVKTSLAPGSRAVTDYLRDAGLMPYLEALGFQLVGYGCTTCIGNSGPLIPAVAAAVDENNLVVAAVLSGNRNFEGRIHPQVRASFLASPPLVVAYALAGTVDVDLLREPIGRDASQLDIYLRDIWPSPDEVRQAVDATVSPDVFRKNYASVFEGDEQWRDLEIPTGNLYAWDPGSTYVREPTFFEDLKAKPTVPADIADARVLVMLGDSITTDHISPAGSISASGAAGRYLIEHGVEPRDFNSYGARRGNHEVMVRGTFGNIRLRNELAPDREGSWTVYLPSGEVDTIYDVSQRYQRDGTPLIVIAGREYGSGSSRDWAAKGPLLLGVRAVIAESYERIHRSNLVMMGVLPLQFQEGEGRASLGLDGTETYTIRGIADGLKPGQKLTVQARRSDGSALSFETRVRIDAPIEWEYYRQGGILPMVLRRLAAN
ncbi:MAG TPA: aconitate hydratase AcnA [Chloroflexota bacterium]|nr:aconitate hydratase AcnA [Chloroflexota bacterium]